MFQEIAAQIALSSSSLNLVTVLGVSSTAGILGWRWWKRKNSYKYLESLPSPPRHWLLGNIPQVLAAVKKKKFFQLLFDWSQQLGPMYVYWAGQPVVVLSQPKVIEDTIINGMRDGSLVRSKQLSKAWNDMGGPILLGQNGSEWQWRRKAWNPEFSSSSLSKYVDIISQACEQVIEKIQEAPPSKEVQVDPLFVELTMRVISSLVLGIPVDKKTVSPEGPPLDVAKVYEAMSILGYRFLRIVITGEQRWRKYLPTKNSQNYWAARRYLEEFLAPRVDLALQMREQNKPDLKQVSSLFQESMLVKIAAKEPNYNRESLIGEAIELLIAGTDTTAHSLSFTVAELSLNPRVFQQARAVVDQVWQSQGTINIESFKELSYISAIFKETLRLYSIASGSSSLEAQREVVIEGQVIPRGTKIFWSMLAAGRDPEIYSRPDEFLPERWLDKSKEISQLPMIDFGSGSHRCLGEHLSMLEATVMLALLLRYFDWELVNGRSSVEQLQQNLLIYPSDRMPVRFRLRK
ncbi:cytochrome P450 [Trichormus sp. NMC-1]|uniref:cytochrome P450 n=1 Tax=Trichormus sp. NMC-1 TaxID=1853259 RepID=UPI0008DC0582|nr:cytochrome P450 [Trichormus sp. NMC-1]